MAIFSSSVSDMTNVIETFSRADYVTGKNRNISFQSWNCCQGSISSKTGLISKYFKDIYIPAYVQVLSSSVCLRIFS